MPEPHGESTEQIAENEQTIRRVDSREIDIDGNIDREVETARFRVFLKSSDADWAVEERGLGNALIMGHPDAEHGIGRGGMGDVRGTWTSVTSEITATMTQTGAKAVAKVIAGDQDGVDSIAHGTDGTSPSRSDDGLKSRTDSLSAFGVGSGSTAAFVAALRFTESKPSTIDEIALETTGGDQIGRGVVDSTASPSEAEFRLRAVMDVEGRGGDGGPTVTNDGDTAFADIVAQPNATASHSVLIGTDGTDSQRSDSSLGSQVDSRSAATTRTGRTVDISSDWPASQPAGQPYDIQELGLENSDGLLETRASFPNVLLNADKSPPFGGRITFIPRS